MDLGFKQIPNNTFVATHYDLNFQDKKQFEDLFRTHYQAMANYAMRLLHEVESAENVVQRVFVTLWENRSEKITEGDVKPALIKLTHETSMDYMQYLKMAKSAEQMLKVTESETVADKILVEELEKIKFDNITHTIEFDLEEAWSDVSKKADDFEKKTGFYDQGGRILTLDTKEPKTLKVKSWIGMIVILAILAAAAWYSQLDKGAIASKEVSYSEVQTTENRQRITLVDGSSIGLEASSHLKFFTEKSSAQREVWLDGNASFTISEDDQPFVIHTQLSDITAMGASFEMDAKSSENTVIVTVKEGVVSVKNNNSLNAVQVNAGQMAIVSDEMAEIMVDNQ